MWGKKKNEQLTVLLESGAAWRCLNLSCWSDYAAGLCWGKNIHAYLCEMQNVQRWKSKLIPMHPMFVLDAKALTSPAVQSSGKSWADPQSGCKIAPYNSTQSKT